MPDEDVVNAGESLEGEALDQASDSADESPYAALEQKVAALEQAQRQSVAEIRTAVGRVQSLADRLNKTNDPAIEAKLRTEMSGVSELLGLVTDSIDESILPRDVKRRVADAQAAARGAAADAEINRRIAEATAPVRDGATQAVLDTQRIEIAVNTQIQSLGLNTNDPAFDWGAAARILHTEGEPAMWSYFGKVERELLSNAEESGPRRRGRPAPAPAASASNKSGVEAFLDKGTSDADKIEAMRALGIIT